MKKDLILAAALMLSAIALPSCSNDEDEISPATDTKDGQVTFTASATMKCGDNNLSKAVMTSDMTIYFSPNQTAAVKFLDASKNILDLETFTATNTSKAATVDFSGTVKTSALENAKTITATLPASAVDSDGNIVIPTTQTPEICGFDPAAFIATGLVDESMKATFTADVALLKITADRNTDITIEGTGIAGTNGDKITVTGMKTGKIYYVAVNPTSYSSIQIKSGDKELKEFTNKTLAKGYYYTADINAKVTIDIKTFSSLIPSTATKIVFDYTSNYDVSEFDKTFETINDGKIVIYQKDDEYYVLSYYQICLPENLRWSGSASLFRDLTYTHKTKVTSLILNNFNTEKVKNAYGLFVGFSGLVSLDLSGLDFSNVTNMESVFLGCSALKTINFEGLNTSNVTSFYNTFEGCSVLETLDLSGFNTEKATDTRSMFRTCPKLKTIYVSDKFYVDKVDQYTQMFEGCTSLVGGKGTTFASGNDYKTYARIDDPDNDNPGYFTEK